MSPEIAQIVEQACADVSAAMGFHVLPRDVASDSRIREVCAARQLAIRRAKEADEDLTAECLGMLFGRHHTTILAALGRIPKSPPIAYALYERAREIPRCAE